MNTEDRDDYSGADDDQAAKWHLFAQTHMCSNDSSEVKKFLYTGVYDMTSGTVKAYPGDTVSWFHRVILYGTKSKTDIGLKPCSAEFNGNLAITDWETKVVTYAIEGGVANCKYISGKTLPGSNNFKAGDGVTLGTLSPVSPVNYNSSDKGWSFVKKVEMNDVGRAYCQTLITTPRNSDTTKGQLGSYIDSGDHCIYVPYHYPGNCDSTKGTCNLQNVPDIYEKIDPCTQGVDAEGKPVSICEGKIVKNGITPRTSASPADLVSPGDTVKFFYYLKNSGPTKSLPLSYKAYTFILKSGSNISEAMKGPRVYENFASTNCKGFRGVSSLMQKTCKSVLSGVNINIGSGSGNYPDIGKEYALLNSDGSQAIYTANLSDWSAQIGDKVCSYLMIDNWSVVDDIRASTIAASNIVCVEINKKPQIQIRGADAWAGGQWTKQDGSTGASDGGFDSYDHPEGTNRGSWSQYGVLANNGDISSFGSAGKTVHKNFPNDSCKLIFANTFNSDSCPNVGGQMYKDSALNHEIDLPKVAYLKDLDIRQRALNVSDDSIGRIGVLSGGKVLINLSSITASGVYWSYLSDSLPTEIYGAIKDNVHIIIVASGNLSITQATDTQSSTFSDLKNVPSLVVIAKDIYVKHDVNKIYGTYIARGTFYSAEDENNVAVQMKNGGDFNNQLRVNGAIISLNSPRLWRTFGGGLASSSLSGNGEVHFDSRTASEVFNYQPNLFLTPYLLNQEPSDSYKWVPTSQITLPARF